jgi:hypothetical protein
MKVTLAIVVVLLTSAALNAASWIQSSQQSAAVQAPAPGEAGPQQQGTPPPVSKPCAESKDTCEIEPTPPQTTTVPAAKAEQESPEVKPSPKPAVHSKKSRRHKKAEKQVAAPDPSGPKKIVVRQGGTSDPTVVLTPGRATQGSSTPQMTAELLTATDANLKEATAKPLTATQEETINQIKLFMEQANAAVKAGDLDRGHNLAIKAHLLSDDLVKH